MCVQSNGAQPLVFSFLASKQNKPNRKKSKRKGTKQPWKQKRTDTHTHTHIQNHNALLPSIPSHLSRWTQTQTQTQTHRHRHTDTQTHTDTQAGGYSWVDGELCAIATLRAASSAGDREGRDPPRRTPRRCVGDMDMPAPPLLRPAATPGDCSLATVGVVGGVPKVNTDCAASCVVSETATRPGEGVVRAEVRDGECDEPACMPLTTPSLLRFTDANCGLSLDVRLCLWRRRRDSDRSFCRTAPSLPSAPGDRAASRGLWRPPSGERDTRAAGERDILLRMLARALSRRHVLKSVLARCPRCCCCCCCSCCVWS